MSYEAVEEPNNNNNNLFNNNGQLAEIDISHMILIKNPNNELVLGKFTNLKKHSRQLK